MYAHWLNEEVNYLITDDERQLFQGLKTDDDRDRFIENFWRVRNPDPNAPTNEAKDTHYQRLSYANVHFGYGNVQEGWRSDRGMAYITLGPPQQIQKYLETRELKPIQIWFYQNLTGAVPVHFYLLFYKPSPAEDYELYSPYGDRPQKLINSTNAINNDPVAIKLIQRDIDDEAAHVALSLIPGEPVDLKSPSPSLQSDVLLNNIRNYRNLPQIREMVVARHQALEGVTHRIVLGEQFSSLSIMATRDGANQASIHYLLRLLHPKDFALGEQTGGRHYYSVRVDSSLSDTSGKVIAHHAQQLTDFVPSDQFDTLRKECFGVEGRMDAPAGKYQLNLTLTNLDTKQAFHQVREVLVPGAEDRLGMSQVFFADTAPPSNSTHAHDPFSFSGARLRPIGSDNAIVMQGKPLRAIFQLWEAPGTPAALRGKPLHLHYLIGKLNAPARQEEDQTVDRGSFSPDGNLLMGKDLPTQDLAPGLYRLVIKASDPDTGATAYQSLAFELQDQEHPTEALWTVDAPND
ncbi:GWxTD domain-containing protein [Acidipila sp. EB88]|uniref:GWxTD domain-containing protein n=1 Tax=Acidipila sp. EB88 TaxID=2305226 RepID=UPI001F431E8C|nr:GWxTD domain-containing protein [Acidipila sp. EB88]